MEARQEGHDLHDDDGLRPAQTQHAPRPQRVDDEHLWQAVRVHEVIGDAGLGPHAAVGQPEAQHDQPEGQGQLPGHPRQRRPGQEEHRAGDQADQRPAVWQRLVAVVHLAIAQALAPDGAQVCPCRPQHEQRQRHIAPGALLLPEGEARWLVAADAAHDAQELGAEGEQDDAGQQLLGHQVAEADAAGVHVEDHRAHGVPRALGEQVVQAGVLLDGWNGGVESLRDVERIVQQGQEDPDPGQRVAEEVGEHPMAAMRVHHLHG